jgi:S-DNA-T family DNA segregation ATPase FtsK/SpoIIIE
MFELPPFQFKPLSPERRMDVLGAILSLIGLACFVSLVSNTEGTITGPIVEALQSVAGVGAFLIPLTLLAIGLWLIFRNVDRLPVFSVERVLGLVFLVIILLSFTYLIAGQTASGWLGFAFGELLNRGLGIAGTVVALLAWLLVSLTMVIDISIPDLFHRIEQSLQRESKPKAVTSRPVRPVSSTQKTFLQAPEEPPSDLPEDFQPLNPVKTTARPRPGINATAALAPATGTSSAAASLKQTPTGTNASQPVTQSSPSTTIAPAGNWQIPPIADVLDPAAPTAVQTTVDNERAKIIEETLKGFGAPGHVVEIHRGPTITQFGVEPDFIEGRSGKMRVRVNRIASLSDDLALALSAQRIRIQAPVPGRSYVGIEVPNIENSLVSLREVMESESFRRIRSSLRIALGKDVAGKPISADLTAMPHLLIAGTTGSGKSVCVNSILSCLLLNNTPVDLRLVLVDPKRVELTGYNGIPHLLAPVVVEAERVIGALQWILREMDSRYHRFSQEKVRNIQEYNKSHEDRLPYLVVVIDELADLMMLAPDETERSITRLAQLARATGIHLIIATQRPSVDVVTGLIKANFPARIAFAVASNTDSRVILDQPGAERLLGRGDMLFQAPDAPAPVRLQGVYVSDGEIQRLTETWRLNTMQNRAAGGEGSPDQIDTLPRGVPLIQAPLFDSESVSGEDPLLQEAIAIVRREKKASISMLQRRMRIGYTRSARLIDTMESKGIISPSSVNSQVREVLDFGDEEQSDNGES